MIPSSLFAESPDGRKRLMAAAATQFAAHGFEGASVGVIAAAAGVTKSTVFHHFESKSALYAEVIHAAAEAFGQTLEAVFSDQAPFAERLGRFQAAHLEHIRRNPQVARLILRELQQPGDGQALAAVIEGLRPNFARLVEFLVSAQRAGELGEDVDCRAAAICLVATNVLYFQAGPVLHELAGGPARDCPQRFAEQIADLVFRGLARRPSRPGVR